MVSSITPASIYAKSPASSTFKVASTPLKPVAGDSVNFKGKAWLQNIGNDAVKEVADAIRPKSGFINDFTHNAEKKTLIINTGGDYQVFLDIKDAIQKAIKKFDGIVSDFQR